MPERVNGGHALSAIGALVLLVSLFLHWFGRQTAWTAFEVMDLVLAALALATLAAVLPGTVSRVRGAPAVPASWLPGLGLGALVIVVAALINHPPNAALPNRSAQSGAWVGLAGTALMAVGGLLTAARISLVITTRPTGAPRPRTSRPPVGPAVDEEPVERAFEEEPVEREPVPSGQGDGAADHDTETQPLAPRRRR